MSSILTITLNPAIDKSYEVDHLEPDHKLRCPNPQVDAGGGGINVARGIFRLGGEARAFLVAGGHNGDYLQELLASEKIPVEVFGAGGETRESIMVVDRSTRRQYRIVAEGPTLSADHASGIIAMLASLDPFPSIVVASGSLPKGLPEDYYAAIAALVRSKGGKFILDTGGNALKQALAGGVTLIKPNLRELSALAGREELELEEVEEAAMGLIRQGSCEMVVVSLGSAGAMWVTKDGHRQLPAPTVKRLSTVGAGDSMVAGMVWSMQKGRSLDECVAMGVACGTAATMNPGTQLFRREDAMRLYQWVIRQKK